MEKVNEGPKCKKLKEKLANINVSCNARQYFMLF